MPPHLLPYQPASPRGRVRNWLAVTRSPSALRMRLRSTHLLPKSSFRPIRHSDRSLRRREPALSLVEGNPGSFTSVAANRKLHRSNKSTCSMAGFRILQRSGDRSKCPRVRCWLAC
jgi:hypothetical protein